MRSMGKEKLVALFLYFAVSFIFAQEQFRGKSLIMGWDFVEEDTPMQTNMAIDAFISYAESARLQMSSYERYNASCKIELYRVYNDVFYYGEYFEMPRVFVYINLNNIIDSMVQDPNILIFEGGDYHDRYIEIDFYIIYNGTPSKYKLVFYYNDYNWLKNNKGNNLYELISRGDAAYDFFIYEIERLRR